MVTFFPTPYKDELFYSVLSRYHVRSGNTSYKATNLDLYNRATNNAIELPTNFKVLMENMPVNTSLKVDDFIYKNTMFNYLTAFVTSERTEEVKSAMIYTSGKGLYAKLGQFNKVVSTNIMLKYCPCCSNDDIEKYGETYWRRLHQITGVDCCTKHKCKLQASNDSPRVNRRSIYVNATIDIFNNNDINVDVDGLDISISNKYLQVSKSIEYLLNNNFERYNTVYFTNIYRKKLFELGLATEKELYLDLILIKFKKYWTESYLEKCGLNFDINSNSSWVCRLLTKSNRGRFPLQHILMIVFLKIDIRNIFNGKEFTREIIKCEPKLNNLSKSKSRERWIKIVEANPNLSRRELGYNNETIFEWLIKNDYKWVLNISPKYK